MISIIVPVYNGEAYMRKCLDSVLSSTYRDFELIVVENGSTDATLEIARTYEAADSRVRVITTDVKGLSHARNLGIAEAKGEYLAFVDADDYISPYMYREMVRAAAETESDFVICSYLTGSDYDYVFEDREAKRRFLTVDEYYREMYIRSTFVYSVAWNKLIRRDCLGDVRFDEELTYFEDRNFAARCVCRAEKICFADEPLYYYWRGNENSISLSADQHKRMFQIYALEKDLAFMDTAYPDKPFRSEYVSCNLLQNADFRMKRAREEKLTDLQTELKPIVKNAARRVRRAKHLPRGVRTRFLIEHDFPHLFALAGKIRGR
ncbi:MAG: glycosyltransferase [Clostridia bacterium]|nr:glycosyltransferase [Clostridia bacterium]